MFRHLGFCWPWRGCPSQGELVPRDSEQLTGLRACWLNTNQKMNPELTPQPSPLLVPTLGQYLPSPVTPGPGTRQLRTPRNLLKLLRLANRKLLALPHMFLFMETTVKALALSSSLSLSPDQPQCSSVGPTIVWLAPFSWELWVTNCFFYSKHLLIC